MPELPDVAVFKRYADATALYQTITSVSVQEDRILEDLSPQTLRRRVKDGAFTGSRRHGKHLFMEVGDRGWLTLHFGMTAFLKYHKDPDAAPAHERLSFGFANGYRLAYDCRRILGRVGWTGSVEAFVREKSLGPDALDEGFDLEAFRSALSGKRGKVKSALMDQKMTAGIGNVYSDEILFHAGILPQRKIGDLSGDEVAVLFEKMKWVLGKTIDHQADPDRLPDGFLLPHRGRDGRCPACDEEFETQKVSGRTSWFCPRCQK